ncbi:MAG: hypothetical protein ACM3ON_00640 [Chloroflexota bacterium]
MNYREMGRTELEAVLKRLRFELEDLEDMIGFDYTFTSAHIGGSQVRKDETTLIDLKEQILFIEELLSGMDGSA